MKKKVRLTESELTSLIKKIIKEQYYNSEKLYNRDAIINSLKRGPRELKKYITKLPSIPCTDPNTGQKHVCTKIPEVIYVYITGNY
jgi:hypothetical protein